jgi:hypothetical protein
MKEYHGARIAGREELDGVDFASEVQLAIDDLAGSMREGLLALSVGGGPQGHERADRGGAHPAGRAQGQERPRARRQAPRLQAGASGLGRTQGPGPAPPAAHRQRQGGVEVAHVLALRLRGPAPGADRRARAGGALDPPLPRCLVPTGTAVRSVSRSAVSRRFVKRTGPALYSLRVGLGGERRRHRRHVSRLDGWRDKRVKPRRRVLQSRSRRRPELARTTRG